MVLAKAFIEDKAPGGNGQKATEGPRKGAESRLTVLDYYDLATGKDLSDAIKKALGPDGLGALVVCNVPGYAARRQALLPLAGEFASLPDEVKAQYEDPASHFSVGWSHGKEHLASGLRDLHKGSFYANPLVDDQLSPSQADALKPWIHEVLQPLPAEGPAAQDQPQAGSSSSNGSDARGVPAHAAAAAPCSQAAAEELRRRYPGYYRPNVWPRAELPELEPALKDLGRLVCAVGLLLADHCDSYVSSQLGTQRGQLSGVLRRSLNPKARLLHYFASPPEQGSGSGQQGSEGEEGSEGTGPGSEHEQPWCGWHSDHGSLTGLTAAMYLDAAGRETACPDANAGLYIRDRHGHVVRAVIPQDCIAFQVGEALQVHSGGLLMATPHYVRAASGRAAAGVSRNTFAVFMQPDVAQPMDCPQGVDPQRVAVGQWQTGMRFGEFAEATFERYYPGRQ